MKSREDQPHWRQQPIAWGVAIAVVVAAAGVVAVTHQTEGKIRQLAREAVEQQAKLDRSNYVTRGQLNGTLQKIHDMDRRLIRIELTLDERLPNIKRWFDLGTHPIKRRRKKGR